MIREKNVEHFFKNIEKRNSQKFEIIGEFKGQQNRIEIKCKKCGGKFNPKAYTLFRKLNCPFCKKNSKDANFRKKVKKANPSIKIIGTYVAQRKRICVACKICGTNWTPVAQTLLRHAACPNCKKQKRLKEMKRRTIDYTQKVKKLNPNIDVIGNHLGQLKPIKLKCKICNNIFNYQAASFLSRGAKCPVCSKIKKRKEKNAEFSKKIDRNIEVLGLYQNKYTPIKVKCKKCNHVWEATPKSLINGATCPACKINEKAREFKVKLRQNNKKNIIIKGNFINLSTPIEAECGVCGYQWSPLPYNLLNGTGCPKCSKHIKITPAKFIKRLKKINPDIKVIGKYTSTMDKIKVECLKCGYIWCPQAQHLLEGHGCPKCAGNLKLTLNDIRKRLHKIHPDYVIPDQEYKGYEKKIKVICSFNHEWKATPHSLVGSMKSGCPKCNGKYGTSFPEQAIYYYIKKAFPEAKNDYRAKWLKRQTLDIFIPKSRFNRSIAIEYDGYFFHTKKRLESDNRKYQKCKDNNVFLIRVVEVVNNDGYKNVIADNDKVFFTDTNQKKLGVVIQNLINYLIPNNQIKINLERDTNTISSKYMFNEKQSLASEYPELAKEWDEGKNYPLKPSMVKPGYQKKVWWKCLKNKNHPAWQATVYKRAIEKHRCPRCSKSHKKSNNEFQQILAQKNKERNMSLETLEPYKGMNTKIKFHCLTCDYKWNTTPGSIVHGNGCPKCSGNYHMSADEVLKDIQKNNKKVIDIDLSNYRTQESKISCRCRFCGKSLSISVLHLRKGSGCASCSAKRNSLKFKMTDEEFKKEAAIKNPLVKILSKFQGDQKPVLVKCIECGKTWKTSACHILEGRRRCGCNHRHSRSRSNPNQVTDRIINSKNLLTAKEVSIKTKISIPRLRTIADKLIKGRGKDNSLGINESDIVVVNKDENVGPSKKFDYKLEVVDHILKRLNIIKNRKMQQLPKPFEKYYYDFDTKKIWKYDNFTQGTSYLKRNKKRNNTFDLSINRRIVRISTKVIEDILNYPEILSENILTRKQLIEKYKLRSKSWPKVEKYLPDKHVRYDNLGNRFVGWTSTEFELVQENL